MFSFLTKSKDAPARKKPDARLASITAKPVQVAAGELIEADDGSAKLKVKVQPKGVAGRFFRVPDGTTKTFELDEIGVFVWKLCDGKTSVQQIMRKLAKRYNLNLREAEVSTLQFIRVLIRKGLLAVAMDKKD